VHTPPGCCRDSVQFAGLSFGPYVCNLEESENWRVLAFKHFVEIEEHNRMKLTFSPHVVTQPSSSVVIISNNDISGKARDGSRRHS
jgi:hypothetical protein